MAQQMQGKVAVVTGAGEGQGKAAALLFAAEGAQVVAADISGKQEETAAESDGDIVPVQCDVSVPAQVEAMVRTAVSRFGRLDVLCNVAGIALGGGMIGDDDPDVWDRVQAVNLKGVFLGIKYGAPAIVDSGGGSILNWGSIGGIISSGMSPGYSASKAGVISLTKNAAIQYSPRGRARQLHPARIRAHPDDRKGTPATLTRSPRTDACDDAGQSPPRTGDDRRGNRRGRPLAGLTGGGLHHRGGPAG